MKFVSMTLEILFNICSSSSDLHLHTIWWKWGTQNVQNGSFSFRILNCKMLHFAFKNFQTSVCLKVSVSPVQRKLFVLWATWTLFWENVRFLGQMNTLFVWKCQFHRSNDFFVLWARPCFGKVFVSRVKRQTKTVRFGGNWADGRQGSWWREGQSGEGAGSAGKTGNSESAASAERTGEATQAGGVGRDLVEPGEGYENEIIPARP